MGDPDRSSESDNPHLTKEPVVELRPKYDRLKAWISIGIVGALLAGLIYLHNYM